MGSVLAAFAGEWPIRPETRFAGGSLAERQRWEAYGPSLILHHQFFPGRVQHQGALRAFGYAFPQLRRDGEAASMSLLLGSAAIAAEVGALTCLLLGWRSELTGSHEPPLFVSILDGSVPRTLDSLPVPDSSCGR